MVGWFEQKQFELCHHVSCDLGFCCFINYYLLVTPASVVFCFLLLFLDCSMTIDVVMFHDVVWLLCVQNSMAFTTSVSVVWVKYSVSS